MLVTTRTIWTILRKKALIKITFELNNTLFAEAELEETDEVYLWLGVRLATRLTP